MVHPDNKYREFSLIYTGGGTIARNVVKYLLIFLGADFPEKYTVLYNCRRNLTLQPHPTAVFRLTFYTGGVVYNVLRVQMRN
jgi:hypothetical protein